MEKKKIMAWLKGEMEKVAESWSVFFFFLSAAQEYVIQKKNWNGGNGKGGQVLKCFFSFVSAAQQYVILKRKLKCEILWIIFLFSCGCSHFLFDSSCISLLCDTILFGKWKINIINQNR
jgi:hypothetical protein